MKLDVENENLCINKMIGYKKDNIIIEGDMIVPDIKPDIINTISVSGNPCVYKKEVLDGKVRLDGNIDVYIVYLADDEENNARGLNTSIDFTHILDMQSCMSGMSSDEIVNIKNIECKVLNGRKVSVKATLEIEVKVYSNEELSIIKNINEQEHVKCLKNTIQIDSLIGEGETKTTAKDTIVIDNMDNLTEILKVNVNISNHDDKISYNKVLSKADANVKIMYLTDDGRIRTIENIIPIMGFIDISDVAEDSMCDSNYILKNIIIKPNSVEEHSIYVELEVGISIRAYQKKEVEMIQDLYSPLNNTEFKQKQVKTMTNKRCMQNMCNINERINIPEIGENEIYDVEVRININNEKILSNRILYDGEISLNFLFQSNNIAKIDTKSYNIPFNYELEVEGININQETKTRIELARQDFIISQNNNIDSNINLIFYVNTFNLEDVNIIEDIDVSDEVIDNPYSMTIYFVKPGDTLWNIAKRYHSTVEDIARVNELEDVNNIYPKQQLFIPKYVCRNSA